MNLYIYVDQECKKTLGLESKQFENSNFEKWTFMLVL